MVDGLWTVEFSSALNLFGRGVLVLYKQKLLGGDAGYYYSGEYDVKNNTIRGEVDVIRFDENSISVVGDLDQFCLTFTGQLSEDEFTGEAKVKNKPDLTIKIQCRKKESL
jgi:hypothetical protein